MTAQLPAMSSTQVKQQKIGKDNREHEADELNNEIPRLDEDNDNELLEENFMSGQQYGPIERLDDEQVQISLTTPLSKPTRLISNQYLSKDDNFAAAIEEDEDESK